MDNTIFLVDIYHIFKDRSYITERPYVPLALCYLTGSLKDAGYNVIARHVNSAQIDTVLEEINEVKPAFVGVVNILIGKKLKVAASFSERLRNMSPETPIVWGGYFPSSAPEICLNSDFVDMVGIGDGEEMIVDIAEHYDGKRSKESIPAISYVTDDGINTNPLRGLSKELDEYWPDFSFLDLSEYITVHNGKPLLQNALLTSRGCPYECTFCCHAAIKKSVWRAHSPEYIKKIVQDLKKKADFEYITISDDNFGASKQHMFDVIEVLNREGARPIVFAVRIKGLTEDDVNRLSELGVESLFFGAESFLPRKLELFKKNLTTSDIYKGLNIFTRNGGPCLKANVIIGVPTESRDELRKELSLAFRESRFPGKVVMSFSLFFPLPKTPMLKLAVENGYKEPKNIKEWSEIDNESIWDKFTEWVPWMTAKDLKQLKIAWRYNTEILYFPELKNMGKLLRWGVYLLVYPVYTLAKLRIRHFAFMGYKVDFCYIQILHYFWEMLKKRKQA